MHSRLTADAPLKVIGYITNTTLFYLAGRPETERIADVRGKVVAASSAPNGGAGMMAYRMVEKAGVPPSEVTFLNSGTPTAAFQPLVAGVAAAAIVPFPTNLLAEREGMHTLGWAGEVVHPPHSGLVTTAQILAERPALVTALLRGTIRSIRYVNEHPEETIAAIQEQNGIDRALAEQIYVEHIRFYATDGSARGV